jgi:MerR family transcriptional regulator, light-induced transcriptional regulator
MMPAASQAYHPVNLDRDRIALKAYDRYGEKYPEVYRNSSASQKTRMLEDFRLHLQYLEESLAIGDAAIFLDYAGWAQVLYSSQSLPKDYLSLNLMVLRDVLREELPPEMSRKTDEILTKSLVFLATAPTEVPSFILPDNPLATVARAYLDALLAADRNTAFTLIHDQVKNGVAVKDIYLHVFEPVLREVGRLWQMQKMSVSKEHYVTAATQMMFARLAVPDMDPERERTRRGRTLVAACVSGELHEMGIRMVTEFFEMDGWDTYYIGANTPAPGLIAAVQEQKADVVLLSSTMPCHLPRVDYLIRSLRGDPGTRHVKILVGGYPFNLVKGLWQNVGADAYAAGAGEAVAGANRMVPPLNTPSIRTK